jgi:hypothetical protein
VPVALLLALSFATVAVAQSASTFVERGGTETYLRQPSLLSFSVDGDLEGEHLRWSHWGGGYAIAHGTIYERDGYPTYATSRVSGAIKLNDVRWCDGRRYYTNAVFYPNGPLLFRPGLVNLITPCEN